MKAHVFALCLSLSLCLGLPLPALAFASPFTDVQETSPTMMPFCGPQKPASPTAPQRPPSPRCALYPGPAGRVPMAGGRRAETRAGRTAVHGCDGSQRLLLRSRPVGCREGYVGIRDLCAPCGVYPAGRGILPVARRRQPGYGGRISLCRRPLRGRRRTRTAPLPVC